MNNSIICIGQCGANIVNNLTDNSILSEWETIYIDNPELNLDEIVSSRYNNVYIFCGLGGDLTNQYILEVITIFRPLALNLLCFCSFPFRIGGRERYKRTEETIAELWEVVDIVVVQSNDKLPGEDNLSRINRPIVSAADGAIRQSNRPLLYALSAIIEVSGIQTGFKAHISTDSIDIFVNKIRLKNLVSEALRVNKKIISPTEVSKTLQVIWTDYHSGRQVERRIYEVELPLVKS